MCRRWGQWFAIRDPSFILQFVSSDISQLIHMNRTKEWPDLLGVYITCTDDWPGRLQKMKIWLNKEMEQKEEKVSYLKNYDFFRRNAYFRKYEWKISEYWKITKRNVMSEIRSARWNYFNLRAYFGEDREEIVLGTKCQGKLKIV